MATPTRYTRTYNFNDLRETEDGVFPASAVEVELDNIELTTDEIIDNLRLIQRDDGQLKNGIVTSDSLAAGLSIGFTFRGTWESGVPYLEGDGVLLDSRFYRASSSHTSAAGNAPGLTGSPWEEMVDFAEQTTDAEAARDAALAAQTAAASSAASASSSAAGAASDAGLAEAARAQAVASASSAATDAAAALAASSAAQTAQTQSEAARDDSVDAAADAQQLVQDATAGFTGFLDGQGYDFGLVSDATTYFNRDWGALA